MFFTFLVPFFIGVIMIIGGIQWGIYETVDLTTSGKVFASGVLWAMSSLILGGLSDAI